MEVKEIVKMRLAHVTLAFVLTCCVSSEEKLLGYGTKFGTVATGERSKVIGKGEIMKNLQSDNLH